MVSHVYRLLGALFFSLSLGMPAQAGPISPADQIVVNGTTWAQVDLFTNLSWNDINAVCPGGNCFNGGTLNGFDMTGWTWASASDLYDLFTVYSVPPGLSPSVTSGNSPPNDQSFWEDGWRPTISSPNPFPEHLENVAKQLRGIGYTVYPNNNVILAIADDTYPAFPGSSILFLANNQTGKDGASEYEGGWFYKTEEPAAAPTPGVLPLVALALAALGIIRRRRI